MCKYLVYHNAQNHIVNITIIQLSIILHSHIITVHRGQNIINLHVIYISIGYYIKYGQIISRWV